MPENDANKSEESISPFLCSGFSFEQAINNTFQTTENLKKKLDDIRIGGEDLFSIFTANIIKERITFTR